MDSVVTLDNGIARVGIVPEMGAGLAFFDVREPSGQWQPILRPWPGEPADGPFALASNLLLPWSGRISKGGFEWHGQVHHLSPNLEGERFPIHGNGFQQVWHVIDQATHAATLTATSEGPGPYRYDACVRYELTDRTLRQSLSITNRAGLQLPYGLGFHPWFIRTPETTLEASACTVWLEDSDYLPAGRAPVADRADWDFAAARELPATWINNLFTGWPRKATLRWPDRRLAAAMAASEALAAYLVYSPSADAGFVCIEPVSHLIDAHNLGSETRSELGPDGGLVALQQSESLDAWMTIEGLVDATAKTP